LDIPGGNNSQGIHPILFPSHKGSNQEWEYTTNREIKSNLSGLLLDVKWGDTSKGTPVHMWPRNGTSAQKWNVIYELI